MAERGEVLDLSAVQATALRGGLPNDVYRYAMALIETTIRACQREARASGGAPWGFNYGTLLQEAAEQTMREDALEAPHAE